MFTLRSKDSLISFEGPVIMGIINITPDSFYKGSRNATADEALFKAESMLKDGALILDVGGQSTSPKSKMLTADEESKRVIPVIEAIKKEFPESIVSIDSFYSQVIESAVSAGADIVNDISAGQIDEKILEVTGKAKLPYILMHMRGTPQTMQENTGYTDLVPEIIKFFNEKIEACRAAGITDIIIDPGFGFSKTIAQNFELMNKLEAFKIWDFPLLVGVSRKSMLYKTLGISEDESLNATSVMNTVAVLKGASVLRVHDVKPAAECIKLIRQLHQ